MPTNLSGREDAAVGVVVVEPGAGGVVIVANCADADELLLEQEAAAKLKAAVKVTIGPLVSKNDRFCHGSTPRLMELVAS
jgi:hypothetical protein